MNISKLSSVLSFIAAGVIVLLLGYLFFEDNIELFQERQDMTYTRIQDYSCTENEDSDTPIGIIKEYEFVIPEYSEHDMHLSFYVVHQYVEVYIDEKPVYSLRVSAENKVGKTTGGNWVTIPIYHEDIGRKVRVSIIPVYESFRNREPEFLLGSRLEIYTERLSRDLPQIILSALIIFTGFVYFCIAIYSIYKYKRGRRLVFLGIFSIMMGLWRLTDTRFSPFMLQEKPSFLFHVSIAMLMLGIIPLMRFIRENSCKRSRLLIDIYCIIASVACLAQILLELLGIIDLRDDLFVTHLMILFGACCIVVCFHLNITRMTMDGIARKVSKLPLICVGGIVADVVVFYIKGTSSGLLFSMLSFLLYILFMGIITLMERNQQEQMLKEQEAELAQKRVAIMLSQIQPHFLYNSLGAIRALCGDDSKEARDAIDNFSIYLRGNMDSLKCLEPIPFTRELEHIETYLKLEKLRFGKRLNVVYSIMEKNFFIPALTLQPIVENAVRHGVGGVSRPVTVTLRTERKEEAVYITVSDDGAGYDCNAPVPQDGRSHVGLENVRIRLEKMINAQVISESVPGKGTTVTIIIGRQLKSE